MIEKRFNCHVKFSAMPNGIMVLDYERHGDEQTVIEDISREKAHRVRDRLNELSDENEQLKSDLDYFKAKNGSLETGMFNLERENEQLKQQLDYADDLIHSHLSEHFIRQWTNFKIGHKEYNDFWEEKLKKYNGLER